MTEDELLTEMTRLSGEIDKAMENGSSKEFIDELHRQYELVYTKLTDLFGVRDD